MDLVRRLYESLARRDGVAAFDVYAEDIIWDVSQSRTAFLYTQPVSRGTKVYGAAGGSGSPRLARSMWTLRS